MDPGPVYCRPHYHIRWKNKQSLDWECFQSYSEAGIRAAELVSPSETFTIEEVSSECPSLMPILKHRISN
jgi:hypothetical protein